MAFANRRRAWQISGLVLTLVFGDGLRSVAEDAPATDSDRLPTNIHDSSSDAEAKAADDHSTGQKGLREELKKLDDALANDCKDMPARQRRAEIHLVLGENDLALADADWLIAEQPDEGSYHRLRGRIHSKLEDYKQAIVDFSEALHLDPEDAESYRERGIAYCETDNYKAAAVDLNSAILRAPDDEIARWRFADVLSQLGKYEDAIREADYLVEKSPDNSSNLRLRGYIQQDWGFFDKGLADLSQAIRLDPKDAKAHRWYAKIFHAQGRDQEAVAMLDKAIELDPKEVEAYVERATVDCAMTNWPAALAGFSEAARLNPTWGHALVQRAAIRALTGDRQRAIADYSVAMAEVAPRTLAVWQDPLYETTSKMGLPPVSGAAPAAESILAEFTVANCGVIVVTACVGEKTLRMALDTGADCTMFDESLRDLLGAEIGMTSVSTPGGPVRASKFGPITLSLGSAGKISTRGPTFCANLGVMNEATDVRLDGIVGMDVLSQFVFQVDLARRKAYLLRSCPDDAGVAVPFMDPDLSVMRNRNANVGYPAPEILLTLPGGNEVPFLVDTGYAGSLGLESTICEQAITQQRISLLGDTLGGGLQSVETRRLGILETIRLGEFQHRNLMIDEVRSFNIIGLNYLARFVVTFDFPRRRLLLRPSPLFAVSEAERTLRMGKLWIDGIHTASPAEMVECLDKLIRADPGNPARYMPRVRYRVTQGNYDQAIEDLDVMIRLNPRDATSFYARGNVFCYKRDADHAMADFDQAIALEPTMTSAWRNRGLVWATKGDFQRALHDLDEALRLSPTYKEAAEERRLVLAALERRNAASVPEKSVAPRACCPKKCRAHPCLRRWRQRRMVFAR